MSRKKINFKITGEAGQGLNVAALTLGRVFVRKGFHAFLLTDNPNSIKLEHTWCSLRLSTEPLTSHTGPVDVLAVLSRDALLKRQADVKTGGFVIADRTETGLKEAEQLPDINYLDIPLARIAAELKAPELMRNTILLGAFLALIDFAPAGLEGILAETFQRKGAEVVGQNLAAVRAGYEVVRAQYAGLVIKDCFPEENGLPGYFLTGNDALAAGAVRAGCKFLAAYPMTPSSPILHSLAAREREYSLIVKHTEDEIAALNMAIGAAYAGVRAMTCTSGGGFSLMTEALGLAAQSETPVVIVVGQRPGPSTGQPTHTSQADLQFVLNASQGEFPRIVLAPGDVREVFQETMNAFNLAEEFQLPVIILTDKYLAESYAVLPELKSESFRINRGKLLRNGELIEETGYRRYRITPDGISPRSLPGQKNGLHTATSYEHDEDGFYQENPAGVKKMYDKRFAKLSSLAARMPQPGCYGPEDAALTLVTWGSTKGPALEALEMLAQDGLSVNMRHFQYLWPLPVEPIRRLTTAGRKTMVIEGNYGSQFGGLIRQETGLSFDYRLLKYDGQPFSPAEISAKVKEVI